MYDLIQDNSRSNSPTNYNSFNIEIVYPDNNENIIIRNCFLIGRAQTIEIDDQVILEDIHLLREQ